MILYYHLDLGSSVSSYLDEGVNFEQAHRAELCSGRTRAHRLSSLQRGPN